MKHTGISFIFVKYNISTPSIKENTLIVLLLLLEVGFYLNMIGNQLVRSSLAESAPDVYDQL